MNKRPNDTKKTTDKKRGAPKRKHSGFDAPVKGTVLSKAESDAINKAFER